MIANRWMDLTEPLSAGRDALNRYADLIRGEDPELTTALHTYASLLNALTLDCIRRGLRTEDPQ